MGRSKFVYERTDLNKNKETNTRELPPLDVGALVEEEDNEETLEQIYVKIQEKLAAKRKKNLKNTPEQHTKGKTRLITEQLVDQEISKLRKKQADEQAIVTKPSDSVTTIYTHACRRAPHLMRSNENEAQTTQNVYANDPVDQINPPMEVDLVNSSDDSQNLNSSDERQINTN